MSANRPLLVVVTGPTASGKTAAALALARHYGTSILSADSRQCFREMTIGVAKPTEEELAQVPHYFINSHSIYDHVDAATFEEFGTALLEKLFSSTNIVVAAGGTGLYIKALCEGMDAMPPIQPVVRQQIRQLYETGGLAEISAVLLKKDPLYAATGEMQNPQRVMRALEVVLQTGQSIRNFQQGKQNLRFFNTLYLGMELPKEVLQRRIHNRVDAMMQAGLLDEVCSLLPCRHLNALQTVGYKELFDYLDGKLTLQEAVEQIKTHTRQYAKRQMTWFRRIKDMHWFTPTDLNGMIRCIDEHLPNKEAKTIV